MKTRFIIYLSLIVLTGVLGMIESLVTQYQIYADVSFGRLVFQLLLVIATVYLLLGRSTAGYILATFFAAAHLWLSAYKLFVYGVLWRAGTELSILQINSAALSVVVVITGGSALILFLLDYLDYRRRRIS